MKKRKAKELLNLFKLILLQGPVEDYCDRYSLSYYGLSMKLVRLVDNGLYCMDSKTLTDKGFEFIKKTEPKLAKAYKTAIIRDINCAKMYKLIGMGNRRRNYRPTEREYMKGRLKGLLRGMHG